MPKLKIAVLASGEGTNFQAIIDAIESGKLHAEIKVLISNEPEARALGRAQKAGIPAIVLNHRDFSGRLAYAKALIPWLEKYGVELIVLAGFMRVLDASIIERFPGHIINIHPSLLPAFPGLNAIQKAFNHGDKETGITVHVVDSGVDTGPIIAQVKVSIEPTDDLESLERKIHAEEHRFYPEIIQFIAQKRILLHKDRVEVVKIA